MSDARRPYSSDLSDAEWALLAPLVPPPASCGRPWKWPVRRTEGRAPNPGATVIDSQSADGSVAMTARSASKGASATSL